MIFYFRGLTLWPRPCGPFAAQVVEVADLGEEEGDGVEEA